VQPRKALAEMVAISSGESLSNFSVDAWISQWLSSKEGSAATEPVQTATKRHKKAQKKNEMIMMFRAELLRLPGERKSG
jgi:hypothetical protein